MSPHLRSLCLAAALLPAAALALDLGGLGKALQSTDKLKKGLDTAKDAAKVLKGVAGIGPEEEKVIGDSVALEIVGKYGGLVRDADILRRVNLVGRSLARYSERPELNWRFGVLDSAAINAFSAPDGYVFITRGLYALADSDDALAAILGHEIAHITGKHALNIVARNEAFSAGLNQLVQRSGEARQVDSQLKQVNLGADLIVKTLFEKGFDPQTEYAADATGRQLAVTTGYAPGALRAVLVRLQSTAAGQTQPFSTHPPLIERIKRLPADLANVATGPSSSAAPSTPAPPPAATDPSKEVDDDDRAFAEAAEKKPAGKKKD
jgi:beta-barrel assembly-enhancing protease